MNSNNPQNLETLLLQFTVSKLQLQFRFSSGKSPPAANLDCQQLNTCFPLVKPAPDPADPNQTLASVQVFQWQIASSGKAAQLPRIVNSCFPLVKPDPDPAPDPIYTTVNILPSEDKTAFETFTVSGGTNQRKGELSNQTVGATRQPVI